jgi:transposase
MDSDLSARHRLVLTMVLNHLRYLEHELASLDRYLIAAIEPYAWAWRLLQTIPGIDPVAAATILIEIGDDLRRFGSAARLASWAALCPGNNESAGKRKSGKTRHGNSSSATCYVKRPMPYAEPKPYSAPNTKAWSSVAATKRRSSPWPTN